jgi:hypothetical protein
MYRKPWILRLMLPNSRQGCASMCVYTCIHTYVYTLLLTHNDMCQKTLQHDAHMAQRHVHIKHSLSQYPAALEKPQLRPGEKLPGQNCWKCCLSCRLL